MALECVLCGWTYDSTAAPVGAYRPGQHIPLRWDGSTVRTVFLTEGLVETIPYVALAAHWAKQHPDQLRAFIGDFVIDRFPRSLL